MTDISQKNTMWQAKVRRLLKEGFGVDDMVALHDMDRAEVRREIAILRESGDLRKIYGVEQ